MFCHHELLTENTTLWLSTASWAGRPRLALPFPGDEPSGCPPPFLNEKLGLIFGRKSLFVFQIPFLFKPKSEMTVDEYFKASDSYF